MPPCLCLHGEEHIDRHLMPFCHVLTSQHGAACSKAHSTVVCIHWIWPYSKSRTRNCSPIAKPLHLALCLCADHGRPRCPQGRSWTWR